MTFHDTPPTKPGAYWFKPSAGSSAPQYPRLVEIDKSGLVYTDGKSFKLATFSGQWSARLVPVSEVEKAYEEGWRDGGKSRSWFTIVPTKFWPEWVWPDKPIAWCCVGMRMAGDNEWNPGYGDPCWKMRTGAACGPSALLFQQKKGD